MATKKKTSKKSASVKKACRRMVGTKEGVKADGTLKKGYRYAKGGRVVKAKTK